ncbi:MAG: nitroreductase family protein [Terriglobales bacterium]
MPQRTEKPLSEMIHERRATPRFDGTPVPDADLSKILEAGRQSPSGYNLQPWRFVVVRDLEQRRRVREAVMGQPRVEEAPVVIVCCGDPEGYQRGDLEEMLRIGQEHGFTDEKRNEQTRQAVHFILDHPGPAAAVRPDRAVWINRQVMIAFTTMMWMAESLGYDTAPMEGFQEDKVREALRIPDRVRVVAILAIGRLKGADKPYGGRFPISRFVFGEEWGRPMEFREEEEKAA